MAVVGAGSVASHVLTLVGDLAGEASVTGTEKGKTLHTSQSLWYLFGLICCTLFSRL